MTASARLNNLTAVIPVWGDYQRFLLSRIALLLSEGVPSENILVLVNDDELTVSLPSGVRTHKTDKKYSIGHLRNLALCLLETDYVCFYDADDKHVPGALRKLVENMDKDPELVLATGRVVRESGEPYIWPAESVYKTQPRWLRILRQWGWNNISMTTGTILRAETVRRAGGFPDYSLAEDGMLACALITMGPIAVLDEPTRVYHVHPQGLCQRGHDAHVWRDAYAYQRKYLHSLQTVPLKLRMITPVYAPVHRKLAKLLSERARHES